MTVDVRRRGRMGRAYDPVMQGRLAAFEAQHGGHVAWYGDVNGRHWSASWYRRTGPVITVDGPEAGEVLRMLEDVADATT